MTRTTLGLSNGLPVVKTRSQGLSSFLPNKARKPGNEDIIATWRIVSHFVVRLVRTNWKFVDGKFEG